MQVNEVFQYLQGLFGSKPQTELCYTTDLELLVSIILSAQCTDKRVNITTKELFRKYTSLENYANAPLPKLESDLSSINFFRNKARHIKGMARKVLDEFDGEIPATLEELVTLPGVGRKTASVFIAEFHGKPAVPVDTHVGRVARRLGWTTSKNPAQIERDLMAIWPEETWVRWHNYMVLFGRYHCTARTKSCTWCPDTKTIKII